MTAASFESLPTDVTSSDALETTLESSSSAHDSVARNPIEPAETNLGWLKRSTKALIESLTQFVKSLAYDETWVLIEILLAISLMCVDVGLDINAIIKFTQTPHGIGYATINAAAIFIITPVASYLSSGEARHKDLPSRGLMLFLGVCQVSDPPILMFLGGALYKLVFPTFS